ncbi:YaaL family protein [Virgibacillus necropolis]|uniref:YaaL family protein n=1 Tax=Virgibacillus necropolis TaxID=163877 RepID=UPI00384A75A1
MGKKHKKKHVDEKLLDTIFVLEREWKSIESIVAKSIEPTTTVMNKEKSAQAKYLFLLREARHRKISAIRYD